MRVLTMKAYILNWLARRRAVAAERERGYQYWHAKAKTYQEREHNAAFNQAMTSLGLKGYIK